MPFDLVDARDVVMNHEARLKAIEELLNRLLKPQEEARPNKIQPRANDALQVNPYREDGSLDRQDYENEVTKDAMTLERVPESFHPPVSRATVIPQRPPKPSFKTDVATEPDAYEGLDTDQQEQDEPIDFPEPPKPVSRPVPVQPPRMIAKPPVTGPQQWLRKPRPQL